MCSCFSQDFMKVLEMSWWAQRGLGGLTIPLCRIDGTFTFSFAQAFKFLAYVASQRE